MDTHILKSSQCIDYLYGRDKTQNLPMTIFSLWSLCRKEDRDEYLKKKKQKIVKKFNLKICMYKKNKQKNNLI